MYCFTTLDKKRKITNKRILIHFRFFSLCRKTKIKLNKRRKNKVKTAVIYARYSSDSQTEQSIEGQLRVCEQYAKNNNFVILNTYIDRAMTGTNDNRPDF